MFLPKHGTIFLIPGTNLVLEILNFGTKTKLPVMMFVPIKRFFLNHVFIQRKLHSTTKATKKKDTTFLYQKLQTRVETRVGSTCWNPHNL